MKRWLIDTVGPVTSKSKTSMAAMSREEKAAQQEQEREDEREREAARNRRIERIYNMQIRNEEMQMMKSARLNTRGDEQPTGQNPYQQWSAPPPPWQLFSQNPYSSAMPYQIPNPPLPQGQGQPVPTNPSPAPPSQPPERPRSSSPIGESYEGEQILDDFFRWKTSLTRSIEKRGVLAEVKAIVDKEMWTEKDLRKMSDPSSRMY